MEIVNRLPEDVQWKIWKYYYTDHVVPQIVPTPYRIPADQHGHAHLVRFGPRGEIVCVNFTAPSIRILGASGIEIAHIDSPRIIRRVEVAKAGIFACSISSVTKYDWCGKELWTCMLPSVGLHATCMTEDRVGGVFVGGFFGNIVRVDANGRCTLVWNHHLSSDVIHMATDDDGGLVVGFQDTRNSTRGMAWDGEIDRYSATYFVTKFTPDLQEVWTSRLMVDPIERIAVHEDRIMLWTSWYSIIIFDADTGCRLRHITLPFFVQDVLCISKRKIQGISWNDMEIRWYLWTCDINEENDRVHFEYHRIDRVPGDDTLYTGMVTWPEFLCIAKCPRTRRVYALIKRGAIVVIDSPG